MNQCQAGVGVGLGQTLQMLSQVSQPLLRRIALSNSVQRFFQSLKQPGPFNEWSGFFVMGQVASVVAAAFRNWGVIAALKQSLQLRLAFNDVPLLKQQLALAIKYRPGQRAANADRRSAEFG